MADEKKSITSMLDEKRRFSPVPEFVEKAHIKSLDEYAAMAKKAEEDFEGFWGEQAENYLTWYKKWDNVLEGEMPAAKWFTGGKLNIAYNCLDRHIDEGKGDKAAIIWEGEPGDTRTLSYAELSREVNRCANALRGLGVGKGDRVAIYLPMIPEAAIAMLACTRIGAVHSVVFGGFSAESLRDRINDQEAVAVITADGALVGSRSNKRG